MTPDEQRGYSKGYAAGQRRAAKVRRSETAMAEREDFTQRAMLAIAAQQIAHPWRRGDQVFKTAPEIAKNIRLIAEEMARQCMFGLWTADDKEGPA